jgi:hypothetical protein
MRAKNTSKQKQENFSKIISLRQIIFARILKKKNTKKNNNNKNPFLPNCQSNQNSTTRDERTFHFCFCYFIYFVLLFYRINSAIKFWRKESMSWKRIIENENWTWRKRREKVENDRERANSPVKIELKKNINIEIKKTLSTWQFSCVFLFFFHSINKEIKIILKKISFSCQFHKALPLCLVALLFFGFYFNSQHSNTTHHRHGCCPCSPANRSPTRALWSTCTGPPWCIW